ncbi:MAG: helix-turn-helix domain-containing protein, partial [Bacteroidia bacterium]
MNDFNFGQNLRIVRQAKGITQDAMSMILGISQTTYSRTEKMAAVPDLDFVERIADVLEVEPSILLSGRQIE